MAAAPRRERRKQALKLKKITVITLALALLLCLCACSRPRLFTSEKLEVEVKGEGSKTLTLTFMGPSTSLYESEILVTEDEDAALAIKSNNRGEDTIKLKVIGVRQGVDSVKVAYYDGEPYALANVSIEADEELKLRVRDISFIGDSPYEPMSGELPEGSEISRGDDSSKLIRLTSTDSPWVVEKYDEDFLNIEEYGFSEESQSYEFLVSGRASGNGSVFLTNDYSKQRICLNFAISSVIDGDLEYLSVALLDSTTTAYDEMESEAYAQTSASVMDDVRRFSSKVFIPASVRLEGCGAEEDFLNVSMVMDDNKLEYLVFPDYTLAEDLAEFKKAFPAAETDSFDTNGVKVHLFQIDDYAVCMWEKDGLLCELYIFDESDIIKAGDVVEAFLSDAAL